MPRPRIRALDYFRNSRYLVTGYLDVYLILGGVTQNPRDCTQVTIPLIPTPARSQTDIEEILLGITYVHQFCTSGLPHGNPGGERAEGRAVPLSFGNITRSIEDHWRGYGEQILGEDRVHRLEPEHLFDRLNILASTGPRTGPWRSSLRFAPRVEILDMSTASLTGTNGFIGACRDHAPGYPRCGPSVIDQWSGAAMSHPLSTRSGVNVKQRYTTAPLPLRSSRAGPGGRYVRRLRMCSEWQYLMEIYLANRSRLEMSDGGGNAKALLIAADDHSKDFCNRTVDVWAKLKQALRNLKDIGDPKVEIAVTTGEGPPGVR
jgi:hypothetical protein